MKRASLTAYPTPPAGQPADLTDRLLAAEGGQADEKTLAPKRRRNPPRVQRVEPAAEPPVEPTPASPPNSLAAALAAADTAAAALRQASSDAPARYDVALRYRLDALAHHLQQVNEFVASLTTR